MHISSWLGFAILMAHQSLSNPIPTPSATSISTSKIESIPTQSSDVHEMCFLRSKRQDHNPWKPPPGNKCWLLIKSACTLPQTRALNTEFLGSGITHLPCAWFPGLTEYEENMIGTWTTPKHMCHLSKIHRDIYYWDVGYLEGTIWCEVVQSTHCRCSLRCILMVSHHNRYWRKFDLLCHAIQILVCASMIWLAIIDALFFRILRSFLHIPPLSVLQHRSLSPTYFRTLGFTRYASSRPVETQNPKTIRQQQAWLTYIVRGKRGFARTYA